MSYKIFDFLVVGGGYSGLSVTTELIDKGFKVILIEKEKFIGGLGQTIKLSNGMKCESFYHHFFTHDDHLLNYSYRFLKYLPVFTETSMSIFYKGETHSWNGILDLIKYPYINLIGKIRFMMVTFLLSEGLLSKKILDEYSLSVGLKKLYGKKAFESIWEPMIAGKFGDQSNFIPLRWMQGRLKQRIQSRKQGKEKLGYIEGSLFRLTEALEQYISKKNSIIKCPTEILEIKNISNNNYSICIREGKSRKQKQILAKNIVFTTSSKIANSLINKININQKWDEHRYFTAYCILIELNQSLSKYYWTNIADNNLFFCGYIEQTRLTKLREYNGLSLAYLTKYVYLKKKEKALSHKELKKKALFALKSLFPDKNIDEIVIMMHVSVTHNAQVITDFNFKASQMDLLKGKNIYLGNMSNVYPEERSINNAIKVGKELSKKIN